MERQLDDVSDGPRNTGEPELPFDGGLAWRVMWTQAFPTHATVLCRSDQVMCDLLDEDAWQWQLAYDGVQEAYERGCRNRRTVSSLQIKILDTERGNQEHAMLNHLRVEETAASPWSGSLGYGEITEQTVFEVIHWIQRHHHFDSRQLCYASNPDTKTERSWCVVDLGSGSGRVLQAAALGCLPVSKVIGLEIVPALHQQALDRRAVWQEVDMETGTVALDFRCSDFTADTDWIEAADLVFVHATVFENALMEQVNRYCARCRPGTYFCLVSRPLRAAGIELLHEMSLQMDWGRGGIFIQQRKQI
jgi:SAM-dependent methyltransferase